MRRKATFAESEGEDMGAAAYQKGTVMREIEGNGERVEIERG